MQGETRAHTHSHKKKRKRKKRDFPIFPLFPSSWLAGCERQKTGTGVSWARKEKNSDDQYSTKEYADSGPMGVISRTLRGKRKRVRQRREERRGREQGERVLGILHAANFA